MIIQTSSPKQVMALDKEKKKELFLFGFMLYGADTAEIWKENGKN